MSYSSSVMVEQIKEYPMAENEATVISIDGNEYDPSDLTHQQKYWIAQVQDLQKKRQATQFQLDQIVIASDSFMNILIESLSEKPESVENPLDKLAGTE